MHFKAHKNISMSCNLLCQFILFASFQIAKDLAACVLLTALSTLATLVRDINQSVYIVTASERFYVFVCFCYNSDTG